jgi:hypothetical protein
VCGVVVEEASREVEVTGSNHGNHGRSVATLHEKMCDLRLVDGDGWVVGRWGLSYRKSFFAVYFQFLSADSENLSASR